MDTRARSRRGSRPRSNCQLASSLGTRRKRARNNCNKPPDRQQRLSPGAYQTGDFAVFAVIYRKLSARDAFPPAEFLECQSLEQQNKQQGLRLVTRTRFSSGPLVTLDDTQSLMGQISYKSENSNILM